MPVRDAFDLPVLVGSQFAQKGVSIKERLICIIGGRDGRLMKLKRLEVKHIEKEVVPQGQRLKWLRQQVAL